MVKIRLPDCMKSGVEAHFYPKFVELQSATLEMH